jgi:pyruvate-ferredoxin/flavodoxin oxidoreductase
VRGFLGNYYEYKANIPVFVTFYSMAVVTQVATLNSRVPFLHFMDGFRTSHEVNKINLVSDEQLRKLMPFDKIEEHRQRALSPLHPKYVSTSS